ncbi:MAG TPA: ABC transporter substrate-binding protein [Armatimonadota bacterium]|nr:ABC transporter substrate-binding protein [Armatimonadota bacterium]
MRYTLQRWFLFSLLFVLPVSSLAGKLRALRIGYQSPVEAGLLGFAQAHGDFTAQGLSVTFYAFQSVDAGITALRNGEINAGAFTLADIASHAAAEQPLTIISGISQHIYSLVTLASVSHTDWSTLSGKTLAVVSGTPAQCYLRILSQIHPTIAIQEFPTIADCLAATRAGTVAGLVIDNMMQDDVTQDGVHINPLPGENDSSNIATVLVVSQTHLSTQASSYDRLVAALLQAQVAATRDIQTSRMLAQQTLGGNPAVWPSHENAWPVWSINFRPAVVSTCSLACRAHHDTVQLDPEVYHRALKILTHAFPHERVYENWLFEIGDFESIKPDCC